MLAVQNLRVIGIIFASWVVTLPAGASLAIVFLSVEGDIYRLRLR